MQRTKQHKTAKILLAALFTVVMALAMTFALMPSSAPKVYADYSYDTLTINDITSTSGSKGKFSWEKIKSVDTSKKTFNVGAGDNEIVVIKYTVSDKSDVKMASVSFTAETHATQGTEHDSFRAQMLGTNLGNDGFISGQGWTYSAQSVQYDGTSNQIIVKLKNAWAYHYSTIKNFNFTITRGTAPLHQTRITAGLGVEVVCSGEGGELGYWDSEYESTTTSIRNITPHPVYGWYYEQYGYVRVKNGYGPQEGWTKRANTNGRDYCVGHFERDKTGYYDFGTIDAVVLEYAITYDLGGGTVSGTNATKYSVLSDSFTLINPTKDNCTFLGWTGSNGNTPQKDVTIAQGSYGDKTYTANWLRDPYSIGYSGMDGADFGDDHPTEATYGNVIQISNPSKPGYTFTGWTATGLIEEAKRGTTETPETAWDGTKTTDTYFLNLNEFDPVTLTANWELTNYNIAYILDDGTVEEGNPATYTMLDDSFTLNNPTKVGYTFAGWTGSSGDTPVTEVTIEQGSYGDKTYTANWTANHYNVNISGENVDVVFGEAIPAVTVPTKDGYTFYGYYDVQNADGEPAPVGTRYTDEKGKGIVLWDKAENDVVLYAYFKTNMTVSVKGYNADYDGKAHGITVTVTVPEDGYTVEYAENEIRVAENPQKTDVGNYTINYFVNKAGYAEFAGSASIVIKAVDKAALTNKINASNAYYNSIKNNYATIADELLTAINNAKSVKDAANVTAQQVATAVSDLQTVLSTAKIAVTESKIGEIGEEVVYPDSANTIKAARNEYNALTEDEKKLVDNYDLLTAAEEKIVDLKAAYDNEKAAEVEAIIEALGDAEPTAEYKQKIVDAKNAYNALTGDQKKLVKNYNKIAEAEDAYRAVLPAIDLSTLDADYTVTNDQTITGTLDKNIKISIANNATIVLDNAHINGNGGGSWAGLTCLGNATIVLKNDNSVNSFNQDFSGVFVPEGYTLTIKGDGKLTANGGRNSAGIGGCDCWTNAGTIVIESGEINAYGGEYGAGIGSSEGGTYQGIEIKGGKVYAKGGWNGAGIGSGAYNGNSGDIYIHGGEVDAYGQGYAAGIGGGAGNYYSGSITITNEVEKVIARNDYGGYVIGRGNPEYEEEEYEYYGSVNIGEKIGNFFTYEPIKPAAVIEKINAIPENVELTDEVKAAIDEARRAYNELAASRRDQVTNYEKLTTAEETYNGLKEIATAISLIDAIPETIELTDEVGKAIEAARAAYDALTDDQKALVSNADVYLAAVGKYDALKDVETAKTLIGNIGEYEYTQAFKEKIDAARKVYDEIPDEYRDQVDNYSLLTAAEAEYKAEDDVVKANEVKTLIDNIPGYIDLDNLAEAEEKVDLARKAYDALSEEAKELVGEDKYHELEQAESLCSILNVIKLINEIPEQIEYTTDCNEKIVAADEAFDALSENEQAQISKDDKDKLLNAKAAYKALDDAAKAASVKELIENIGTVEYTEESKKAIDAARAAYDALLKEAKELVTNYGDLTDAETAYKVLGIEALINDIGKVEYNSESKAAIDAARTAYDALEADEKELVTNYKKLTDSEAAYKALDDADKAEKVKAMIAAIGTVEYTPESKGSIDAARAAYDNLTEEQKALVDNAAVLTAAETTYAEKEAEANAPKGLSGGVIFLIVLLSVLALGCGGFAIYWFLIAKKTWAEFVVAFKKVWAVIVAALKKAWTATAAFCKKAWAATVAFCKKAWTATAAFCKKAWAATVAFCKKAWAATVAFCKKAWAATAEFCKKVWAKIVGLFKKK